MNIFGFGDYEGLLSDKDLQGMQNNALTQMGLSMLANSTQMGYKPRLGQLLAQGYMQGQQSGQGALKNKLQAMTLKDKLTEREKAKQLETQKQMAFTKAMQGGKFDPQAYVEYMMPFSDNPLELQKQAQELASGVITSDKNKVVAPGGALISPSGEVLYQAPFAPEKPVAVQTSTGTQFVQPQVGMAFEAPPKDLPATVLKAEEEDYQKAQTSSDLARESMDWVRRLARGEVPLSTFDVFGSQVADVLGVGQAETQAFKEFEQFKKKYINESLRLNSGVQTEGDAQRAVEEIMSAKTPKAAASSIYKLAMINKRASELARENIIRRRAVNRLPSMEEKYLPKTFSQKPFSLPSGLSGADLTRFVNNLPSGTQYVDPNGNIAVVP